MLIDAGELGMARAHLIPFIRFIRSKDIHRIDQVLISHPHSDHYEGLIPLLEMDDLASNEIYIGPVSDTLCKREYWGCSLETLAQIRTLAQAKNISIKDYSSWKGFRFLPGVKLVKPFQFNETDSPKPADMNDLSLIAKLQIGNKSRAISTGDLNKTLGKWLAENESSKLESTLLKVPHHGTEGFAPDEFFRAVNPKIALFPSPAHLWCSDRTRRIREVLASIGSKIFINGFHGNVVVHLYSDREEVSVESPLDTSPCL